MQELADRARLERFYEEQRDHFRQRPPVLKLVAFEKGEILNDPLRLLNCFYILVRGSVSICHLTEEGAIRYISKAARGTLLGDIEFSGAADLPLYIEAAERVLCLAVPFRENKEFL